MGYSQPVMYTLVRAENGEHFRSIALSGTNDLFVAKTLNGGGEIIVINDYDSILHTRSFNTKGKITIDLNGTTGVYAGDNKKFWIFNQNNLSIIDSLHIPSLEGELKVFFTSKGILFGGVNSTYLYQDKHVKEIKELASYKVFDVDHLTEDMILGYWDKTVPSDVKIRKIFHTNLANLKEKTFLFSTELYTLYAYYMSNAMKIVAVDGAHKVYRFDYIERVVKTIINDKGLLSANKVSETQIAVVTNYRGTVQFQDMFNASSISYVDVSDGKISNTFGIQKRPSAGSLILNKSVETLYFISSGGIVSEVIAIRN